MLDSFFFRLLCGTSDDDKRKGNAPRELTFSYETFRGSSASHFVRLRLPKGEARCPLVVNIHGGFWKESWNLTQTLDTSALLGAFPHCATLDVEYSRVDQDEPSSSSEAGGWPHTCLDVLAAVNSIATHPAAADARERLDLERVYLVGHSAGGQLALWLGCFDLLSRGEGGSHAALIQNVRTLAGDAAAAAAAEGLHRAIRIRGVAAIAPCCDLGEAAAAGLSDYHDAALNFLWRVADAEADGRAAALAAADPLALYEALPPLGAPPPPLPEPAAEAPAAEASAAETTEQGKQADKGKLDEASESKRDESKREEELAPPPISQLRLLLIHGSADVDVPVECSAKFAQRCWGRSHSHPLWLQLIPNADHLEVVGVLLNKTTEAQTRWQLAAQALDAFVREDEEKLSPLCCASAQAAADFLQGATAEHVHAKRTISLIEGGDEALAERCQKDPQSYVNLAQGLQRWLNWTKTAPSPKLWLWLAAAAVKRAAKTSPTAKNPPSNLAS